MIRNYFKIAWRSLLKNKLFSGINIVGLALGMTCSLLIWLWVKDELSYDRFMPDIDQLYAVRINFIGDDKTETSTLTNGLLAGILKKEIPEVQYSTKVQFPQELLIKAGDKAVKENGFYATADFFKVFNVPTIYGNADAALADLSKIIITRRTAEKFFGTDAALGKQLQFNNATYYTVGAVIDDLPTTSSLQFDWLINYDVQEQDWKKTWGNSFCMTYVKLTPQASQAKAEANMAGIYKRYTDWKAIIHPVLQPMQDVHLYTKYENGQAVGGRIEYVRIFALVALFILLIACVNFMNLATARSAMRAKEVGVRKVVGALRSSLIGQFLSEAILTSLLAVVVAILLTTLVLPTFNSVFEKQITLDLNEPILWLSIVVLVVVTGFVAGSYPALFLSSLQPIRILKGTLNFGAGAIHFRRALVVFQFMLSTFLIIGMLVVGRQMNYIQNKKLGLDRENILYTTIEGDLGDETGKRLETFRQELIRLPSIASATTTMTLPQNIQSSSGDLNWLGKPENIDANASAMTIGYDFIRTMGIQLVDGRDFDKNRPADSSAYLINESTVKLMKMQNPVGKQVKFWNGWGPIIGVMKDFHLQSLHQPITPLVLALAPSNTSYILIRTEAGKTQQAIADVERLTKRFNPNYPFDYHFADEEYDKMYRSEQQVNTLINYFGVLAIVISCLGLFGLAAFTAQQRTKEIGVRKVLGASVANIVSLLSTDFLKLVFVALVLATPLAYWALSKWLGSFEYRTELSWWLFSAGAVLATLVALLTISYQSIKAALMNPVKSLRTE
ncbi:ABC transporter permease [Fibrisoma montanum]|uniref:ABC transporter permease n=1 Tax=Fibrisoma montanum TaxID=2305895 RepID=A0A418LVI0_9BACT|nr:ABC transporter permease [Fibrisoma montanum]RIV17237.1 ABC transporter permease [Fibrisoma montanum]